MASDLPDGVVIDSTGADHLHGGEAAMLEALLGRLTLSGITARAAIAGYKGPPDGDGVTEIGCAVVEAFQRRGIAGAAVAILCRRAFALNALAVAAHTLPGLIASQAVLLKNGFERSEILHDPKEGEIWCYHLTQSPSFLSAGAEP